MAVASHACGSGKREGAIHHNKCRECKEGETTNQELATKNARNTKGEEEGETTNVANCAKGDNAKRGRREEGGNAETLKS
jgi:hypothetical protein